jgi:hypothetical protein
MPTALDPVRFLLITCRMDERQLQTIEYLREESRVLCEQLGDRRLRLTDDQPVFRSSPLICRSRGQQVLRFHRVR